jgi:hypothetical protein
MDLIFHNVSRIHQIILSFYYKVSKSTRCLNSDRTILIFIIISIPLHMSVRQEVVQVIVQHDV